MYPRHGGFLGCSCWDSLALLERADKVSPFLAVTG